MWIANYGSTKKTWAKILELVTKRSSDGASLALIKKRYNLFYQSDSVRKVSSIDATNADKIELERLISAIKVCASKLLK